MDILEAARRYEAGETTPALAREMGIAPSTLCNRLRRAGITLRHKGNLPAFDAEKLQRLYELRAEGNKLDYIAAVLGVSVSACAVQLKVHRVRAARVHQPALLELLEQLRKSLSACRAALEADNLDRTTRNRYRDSVARIGAQVEALESVT